MSRPYPLTFRALLLEKPWGGRRLERFGKPLPSGARIGESWELTDLDATAPGGAGGAAARSVIAEGPLAGRSLREAMEVWGEDLTGALGAGPDGSFPLLVKFLDAEEDLSVQVHPTPEHAGRNPGAAVKHETWYVLEAEPGAVLYRGLRPGTDRATFERAVREGRLVEHLRTYPARPGDCHHLPSGTVHALGRGMLVAEIQTPSDTTFRLWDWPDRYERPGRRLHVEDALASCRTDDPPEVARLPQGATEGRLADAGAYDVWELRTAAGERVRHPLPGGACSVLVVLEGALEWPAPDKMRAIAGAGPGTTVLVPPDCRDSVRATTDGRVLAVGFPGR